MLELKDLQINDRIRPTGDGPQPANGYEVMGIDYQGDMRTGPCVVLDWEGRFAAGGNPPLIVKASELANWERIPDETR